jgi:hypothetical protein
LQRGLGVRLPWSGGRDGLGIAEGGGRGPAPDKLAFLRPASHELIATGIVVSDEDDLVDIDPE